jgi:hypothetical protein
MEKPVCSQLFRTLTKGKSDFMDKSIDIYLLIIGLQLFLIILDYVASPMAKISLNGQEIKQKLL